MKGTFLFLGTSASSGVPMVGCGCAVCRSGDPKNKRLRPAGLIRAGGKKVVVDAGPDFRQQALKFGIDQVDGLMLTHTHFDHVAGIDELRVFFVRDGRAVPCLLSEESFEDLKRRCYYFFEEKGGSLSAKFEYQLLDGDEGKTEFLGIPIGYCSYDQVGMKVNGYRVGDFAYISDIRKYEESIFSFLKGVRTLVLSALKRESSPVHFSFDEAVAFAKRVGAKQTWLTHLGHSVDCEEGNRRLPPEIQMGWDGLEFGFDYA
ncbi:MAG TPA: MBL fold metallo-hydrolase [Chlamydiales bacterium]|nr:MBL fold metallo-hydrolase [Chlamydiales bacterium]